MICKIIIIVMYFVQLGFYIGKHGEEKDGTYNGYAAAAATVIALLLFYGAGFFDNFSL